jgi:predicted molibdopterin-dependent oxidoreductase YjgC
MCIICTRCVRACDDLRHTGAITLAGRGYSTRIAFGSGGPVHDSNCDFCGACIDVCPTATLMEKPNKWVARTEDWVSTVCTSCSVGCTISVGHRDGKPVIVKPDTINPFSDDQICVRGRFHYDAIKRKERLSHHMIRRGDGLEPASLEDALTHAVDALATIREQHGPASIGVLGSPFITNEENYLLQRIAREVIGTPHIDMTAGPVNRAASKAVAAAFGTEMLPADLVDIPTTAKTIVVIADDLEASHNVAALRIKDAIDPRKLPQREPARLVLVSPRWGEMADFAEPFGGVWLQPAPGAEPAAVAALARALAEDAGTAKAARDAGLDIDTVNGGDAPGLDADKLSAAVAILREAALDRDQVAVVVAPKPFGAALASETAKAAANLALLLRGADAAASFYLLPTESNVNGARDMGVAPDSGPGRAPVAEAGMDFTAMIDAAIDGKLQALIVAGDNPLMFAPATARVREALGKLDFLLVIDRLLTDTAQLAHAVIADAPALSKDGTVTSADRRVQRLRAAQAIPGDASPAWNTLAQLGRRLCERLGNNAPFEYDDAMAITEEIASKVPGYARFHGYGFFGWSKERALNGATPGQPKLQSVAVANDATRGEGEFALLTGRSLYTSHDGAALHSPDADKLHREEGVLINQYDASELGIAAGADVTLQNGSSELRLPAVLTNEVPRGVVYVSSYYDGGAIAALLPPENGRVTVPTVTLLLEAGQNP